MSYFKQRSLVSVILLYIFTCGIYAIYMFFQFGTEVRNQAIKEGTLTVPKSPGIAFLLTIVTCGIYGIFYLYSISKAVSEIGAKYNYVVMDPALILIIHIFTGVGFIVNIYYASEIAKIA
ncbi:DUF4234 domain-containing protein [Mollicutes bacterium LVI A0039]|nr:DUF4234 domain-containing protein [Mollicutes bacterium LVI A0039]